MKIKVVVPLALALAAAGCQMKMAQQPYGPKEQKWGQVIKENYPDWNPPPTVPPDRVNVVPQEPATIVTEDSEVVDVQLETPPVAEQPPVEKQQPAQTAQTPVADNPAEFQTYTVVRGDTLWGISKRFYGSGKHWKQIYNATSQGIFWPNNCKVNIFSLNQS